MQPLPDIFSRGIRFARSNPQIIYTFFLVIVIPVAFFFTSEQFLKIARDNQDRLERSRIALLSDAFVAFLPDHLDAEYVNRRIADLSRNNETMNTFQVITPVSGTTTKEGGLHIFASLHSAETGSNANPDELTAILMKLARADNEQTFAMGYTGEDGRHWKSVRSFLGLDANGEESYIVTDISMAQADALSRKNIFDAYLVLIAIILLVIGLLARQARIIDYATLYARLKEVDQMKDDFVSMAAHELRSPLTIIRGYVEMLGESKGLPEEGKTYLTSIDGAAVQLNTLVGDILDVSKLQEGRMSFQYKDCDVSEDIAAVVESFMRPAADKGLTLSYTKAPLPQISVDPARLRQVLINLIGNAIKYTPTGSVTVLASADALRMQIRVSDTGMGISADDQQKLFQKFYRVKNEETQKITGTGLGLWITVAMVKAMKGSIAVESIKGKGSDFIVSFPIADIAHR